MKKYSIGLDLGTNSVGWAVVDEQNQIVKKNGFTLWRVRMFEEANSAADRRMYRGSRRRLQRRKFRIKLLQDEFYNEIIKVDSTFFQRLNDSFYKIDDKILNNKYTFFDDHLSDIDFFERFPTIYHLRNYLMNSNKKEDIRMIYLAIHHIIKYRGHFLNETENYDIEDSHGIIQIFKELNLVLLEFRNQFEDNEEYFSSIQNMENEENILKLIQIINSYKSKREKIFDICSLFNVEKKTLVSELVIPLILGSKVNISSLSILKEQKLEKQEIMLDDLNLEENLNNAKLLCPDLLLIFDFIPLLKELTDTIYLRKLIGESTTISEAMIKIYDNHKKQLSTLKCFIKKYCPNKYYECFKKVDVKLNNYPKYIGMNQTNSSKNSKGKRERFSHCTVDEFYSYLKKILESVTSDEAIKEKQAILLEIENNNYLLRQNSSHNTIFPMQLNLKELKEILFKQSEFYPFLTEMNGDLTRIERIISIFKFKISYYVGPLNKNSDYGWVIRKDEKIYPWNYESVIDLDTTAMKFIQRMQNKCTYLHGYDDYCLPKKSLLFSEYNCLQYINKIKINGSEITKAIKEDLFENIFLKIKKPSKKQVVSYLQSNYELSEYDKLSISEVNCDMSSYITFKQLFGNQFERNIAIIEEIIKDITIFEDKKILEKRLREIYSLNDELVQNIKGLNYKGYGALSKKLLTQIYRTDDNGEKISDSIIEIMRKTNLNLQQIILGEEYHYIEIIDDYNNSLYKDDELNVINFIDDNLYVSPIMKRTLIQAYNIIEEVEKILGTKLDEYYIETSRTNKIRKQASNSRYETLKELYQECRKVSAELNNYNISANKLNELSKKLEEQKNSLRSEKIFLYFMQLGKCLYTMEDIDIDQLLKDDYDIDHIYPQSVIKDDSFSNKVLTKKTFNQNTKKDKFLFELDYKRPSNLFAFYDTLLNLKLLTKEKYRRLTQKEMTKGELDIFVNRQIVATSQSTKSLIELLKNFKGVESSKIIYSKAENISDFRQEYDILKSRIANNYHHAHDAYMNVVIGRTLNNYYKWHGLYGNNDFLSFRNNKYTINPMTILSKDRIITYKGLKKVIWDKDNTIKLIKKNILNRFDINETIRTYNSNEMFKKVTIQPAGLGEHIPTKTSTPAKDVTKYGGITSHSYCQYALLETVDKKGKKEYILEAIPRMYKEHLSKYIQEKFINSKIISTKIVIENIKTNVVIEYDKLKFCITGKTGSDYLIKNLKDRNFSYDAIKIIKKIDKYNENIKFNNYMEVSEEKVTINPSLKNKNIEISKDECYKLLNEIKSIYSKNIYAYSIIQEIVKSMDDLSSNSTIKDLIELTSELLKLLKTNERATADLRLIGKSKDSGTLKITKKLKPGYKFISESVTGYYKKVIFEVPNVV